MLLKEAMKGSEKYERVYAFFHYFGMSCFARPGKLFEKHTHIDTLLKAKGFEIEHENIYYASVLNGNKSSDVVLTANKLTAGNQQHCMED